MLYRPSPGELALDPDWSVEVTAEPTAEPVSVAEAAFQLRAAIPTDDADKARFDAEINRLIKAARRYAEKHTGRWLCTQTLKFTLDRFPFADQPIRLPGGPIQAVTALTWVDPALATQTLVEGTDWKAWLSHRPALVYPMPNKIWPVAHPLERQAVTLTLTAGYGGAAAVPEDFKAAILMIVAHNQGNPGDDARPGMLDIPPAARRYLDSLMTGEYP